MEIRRKDQPTYTLLALEGDVDLSTSPQLRKEILESVGAGRPSLIVDLKGVTYMDSSGLATLVEALQLTRKGGGGLALFGLNERIRRIFELARLTNVFDIHEDEAAATSFLEGRATT